MMSLTIEKELNVVNLHIDALERTLSEFSDPKTKAELHSELAKANSRRAILEHQSGSFNNVAAEEASLVEYIEEEPDLPEPDMEGFMATLDKSEKQQEVEEDKDHESGNFLLGSKDEEFQLGHDDEALDADSLNDILEKARTAE